MGLIGGRNVCSHFDKKLQILKIFRNSFRIMIPKLIRNRKLCTHKELSFYWQGSLITTLVLLLVYIRQGPWARYSSICWVLLFSVAIQARTDWHIRSVDGLAIGGLFFLTRFKGTVISAGGDIGKSKSRTCLRWKGAQVMRSLLSLLRLVRTMPSEIAALVPTSVNRTSPSRASTWIPRQ